MEKSKHARWSSQGGLHGSEITTILEAGHIPTYYPTYGQIL